MQYDNKALDSNDLDHNFSFARYSAF